MRALLAGLAELSKCGVDLFARILIRASETLLLDLEVDLLAEDRYLPRSLDADPQLLAHDRKYRNLDVITYHDALVGLAGQYQHWVLPPCSPMDTEASPAAPYLGNSRPAPASIASAGSVSQAWY